jgi:hypothetical protein
LTAPDIPIPEALTATFERLASAGKQAWLVGDCLREMLCGERPRSYEALTTATADEVLTLVSRAIPTGRAGSVLTQATPIGPLDLRVAPQPNADPEAILKSLADRDFRILTPALCVQTGAWVDPWDGLGDLASKQLRRVDDDRAASAIFGLRAARLMAEGDLIPDPGVCEASRNGAGSVRDAPQTLIRRELTRVLLAPRAEAGLCFLRDTGVEAGLIEGVQPDASRLIASLPLDLPIRLTAWLRGTRARQLLRHGRFGFMFSQRIYHLLENHPIDQAVSTANGSAVSRLLDQLGESDVALLFGLRNAEIAVMTQTLRDDRAGPEDTVRNDEIDAARASVAAMENALEAARVRRVRADIRSHLRLTGREIIEILACGEGPLVGRALDFLTEAVREDPTQNTPDALRARLVEWSRE